MFVSPDLSTVLGSKSKGTTCSMFGSNFCGQDSTSTRYWIRQEHGILNTLGAVVLLIVIIVQWDYKNGSLIKVLNLQMSHGSSTIFFSCSLATPQIKSEECHFLLNKGQDCTQFRKIYTNTTIDSYSGPPSSANIFSMYQIFILDTFLEAPLSISKMIHQQKHSIHISALW